MLKATPADLLENGPLDELDEDKPSDDRREGEAPESSENDKPSKEDEEDKAFSKQFFTISRRGHTSATAEFGSPTLVWHVAFWPKRDRDPFSVEMMTKPPNRKMKDDDVVIREFGEAREAVVKDFNRFLKRLQARGRHPGAPDQQKEPFELREPRDWEPATTSPFKVFESEATGFTLWWPDDPAANAAGAKPHDPPTHVMSGRTKQEPIPTDVRVRVLAEVSIDYSTITFFIDAGKVWNGPPVYMGHEGEIPGGVLGRRRGELFKHVKNIRTISEERMVAKDAAGKRLIDLDLLPEPPQICGTSHVQLDGFAAAECAEALKAGADYLYDDIWKQLCKDFGFTINDIAGTTDVVFANFRGLVMSTCGTSVTDDTHELVKAPASLQPADTAHPGSRPFSRFDGGGEGYDNDKVEPNAVVKAYMPFMRRFRSEGDWRDWIACGIFDWRALYITAVGAKSEFAAFDEWDYANGRPAAIPSGQIPQRLVRGEAAAGARSDVPTTDKNDRPAPFRYLLLTKFEPDRRQVGRMIERINSLGARRLFALKDWSVIQNAGMWINHYGRKLDAAFADWTLKTNTWKDQSDADLFKLDDKFWAFFKDQIDGLQRKGQLDALSLLKAEAIQRDYASAVGGGLQACRELRYLARSQQERIAKPEKKLAAVWSSLQDLLRPDAKFTALDEFVKEIGKKEEEYRKVIGDRDTKLGEINETAGRQLIMITKGLDTVGDGAVGGLPYRIAVSRYYAKTFDDAQQYLRVGNIETWWSYQQFAKRGMEPALRSIASVGERLDKLRARLATMKQDILQRSIALQTEATRDNTHRLEQIQRGIMQVEDATKDLSQSIQLYQLALSRAQYWHWIIVTIAIPLIVAIVTPLWFWLLKKLGLL